MGYAEQYANAQDQTFVGKVAISLAKQAIIVNAELSSVPNHNRRVELAARIANDPVRYAAQIAYIVSADPAAVGASDAVIDALVASVWNTVAGLDQVVA